MTPPRFEQLAARLRAHGYPPAYVTRVTNELIDHYESLRACHQSHDPEACARTALAALGTEDEIFQLIVERNPAPFVCRHPVISFVVGPVGTLALATVAAVALGTGIFVLATRFLGVAETQPTFRWLVLQIFEAFQYSVTPAVALYFCYTVRRSGCRWWYALSSCAMLAVAGGSLLTHLVICPASGNVTFFHFYGINPIRVVLPLAVFPAHALFALIRRHKGPDLPRT